MDSRLGRKFERIRAKGEELLELKTKVCLVLS